MLIAGVLAVILPLCLVAGIVASQESCQDHGSPPGLCNKAASHADHLLTVPAPPISSPPTHEPSSPVALYIEPGVPPVGLLSTPDDRAPPLA